MSRDGNIDVHVVSCEHSGAKALACGKCLGEIEQEVHLQQECMSLPCFGTGIGSLESSSWYVR